MRTARAFCDGWLCTGDPGVRVGGLLYIAGGLQEMIIISGRNFFALPRASRPVQISDERLPGQVHQVRVLGL